MAQLFALTSSGRYWLGAVGAFYVVASVAAFSVYAFDKSAARGGRWRVRESTLHLLGLIGGWPGAFLAQRVLHHKSRKLPFQVLFWITATANCALLIWLTRHFS